MGSILPFLSSQHVHILLQPPHPPPGLLTTLGGNLSPHFSSWNPASGPKQTDQQPLTPQTFLLLTEHLLLPLPEAPSTQGHLAGPSSHSDLISNVTLQRGIP